VIARRLPSEYVGRIFLSAAFDLLAVYLSHRSHKKKTTLIAERGLLLTHFYRRCLALCCHHLFFRGDGIDQNRFPSAFRDSGADRIQVDALSGELV